MTVPVELALLWLAFGGSHLVLSSARLRPVLVGRLGQGPFLALYSVIALGLFVRLVALYWGHRHAGATLWTTLGPAAVARALNYVLMAAALVLVTVAVIPGSAPPSAMTARGPVTARGVLRITRHPLFSGLGLFGLAHLLVNGSTGDLAFFGGFPLFAWIGARHQDARLTRDKAGYAALVAETSVVPFLAVLTGRQRLVAAELPWRAMAVGLALTVALRHWHDSLV